MDILEHYSDQIDAFVHNRMQVMDRAQFESEMEQHPELKDAVNVLLMGQEAHGSKKLDEFRTRLRSIDLPIPEENPPLTQAKVATIERKVNRTWMMAAAVLVLVVGSYMFTRPGADERVAYAALEKVEIERSRGLGEDAIAQLEENLINERYEDFLLNSQRGLLENSIPNEKLNWVHLFRAHAHLIGNKNISKATQELLNVQTPSDPEMSQKMMYEAVIALLNGKRNQAQEILKKSPAVYPWDTPTKELLESLN